MLYIGGVSVCITIEAWRGSVSRGSTFGNIAQYLYTAIMKRLKLSSSYEERYQLVNATVPIHSENLSVSFHILSPDMIACCCYCRSYQAHEQPLIQVSNAVRETRPVQRLTVPIRLSSPFLSPLLSHHMAPPKFSFLIYPTFCRASSFVS